MSCTHPAGTEALQRKELVQAFGETAVSLIPLAPGYAKLKNEMNSPVLLARLECGHFSMRSVHTEDAAKALETLLTEPAQSLEKEKAERDLSRLLASAKSGTFVNPAEVVAAREAVYLATLAEEGRLERLREEYLQAQAETLAALEDPIVEELTESRDHLDELQRAAVQAITALLDAVDEDTQLHADAASRLIEYGANPDAVQRTRGYVHTTTVKGRDFPSSLKMEWVIGILNTVKHATKHRNSFYGMEGRDLGKGIPPNCPGTPVPEL